MSRCRVCKSILLPGDGEMCYRCESRYARLGLVMSVLCGIALLAWLAGGVG